MRIHTYWVPCQSLDETPSPGSEITSQQWWLPLSGPMTSVNHPPIPINHVENPPHLGAWYQSVWRWESFMTHLWLHCLANKISCDSPNSATMGFSFVIYSHNTVIQWKLFETLQYNAVSLPTKYRLYRGQFFSDADLSPSLWLDPDSNEYVPFLTLNDATSDSPLFNVWTDPFVWTNP